MKAQWFALGVVAGATGLFVFATGALVFRELNEERQRSRAFAAIIRQRYGYRQQWTVIEDDE